MHEFLRGLLDLTGLPWRDNCQTSGTACSAVSNRIFHTNGAFPLEIDFQWLGHEDPNSNFELLSQVGYVCNCGG